MKKKMKITLEVEENGFVIKDIKSDIRKNKLLLKCESDKNEY